VIWWRSGQTQLFLIRIKLISDYLFCIRTRPVGPFSSRGQWTARTAFKPALRVAHFEYQIAEPPEPLLTYGATWKFKNFLEHTVTHDFKWHRLDQRFMSFHLRRCLCQNQLNNNLLLMLLGPRLL